MNGSRRLWATNELDGMIYDTLGLRVRQRLGTFATDVTDCGTSDDMRVAGLWSGHIMKASSPEVTTYSRLGEGPLVRN